MSKNTTPKNILNYLVQELKSKFAEKSEIPSVNNNTITTQLNGTTVDSFTLNQATDKIINIQVSGSKSINGNPIAIEDAANAYAEEVIANIEPIQDLHGYDHPWVGGAGKNLYVGSPSFQGYITNGTWESVSETYNGHPVMKQTAKAWGGLYKRIYLENGSYIFSAMVKTGSSSRVFIFALGTSDPATISPENSHAYTIDTSWTRISFSFQVTTAGYLALRAEAETDVDLYISEYQLEKGSSATAYEPYENICPISGLDSVEVKRTGKNLFDSDTLLNANGWTKDTNGVYSGDNRKFYLAFRNGLYMFNGIDMTNVQVTFSLDSYGTYNGKNLYIGFYYTDGTFENIALNTTSWSHYNFTSNANKIIDFVYGSYSQEGTSYIKNFQIELGSTATEYEPYQSETHTASLPQTVYGGTLNVQTGELVVDRGYVEFDGSSDETWSASNNRFVSSSLPSATYLDNALINVSSCNIYKGVNMHTLYANRETAGWVGIAAINKTVYVVDNVTFPTTKDVTAWKTYLSNSPLQVCYQLANPQTYHLTPSQVKLLLEHNNISTNADTLDIVYQVNNVLGEILSESEEYTDRVNKSEIIEITPGDGTTSRTFTFSRTPKKVTISWDETDNWCRYHTFLWGDKRTYGFAGNVNSALTGQYAIVAAITYGADGKSFVVSGENASAAFNTTTGSGRLFVEY